MPDPRRDRSKNLSLAQLGLLLIVAGLLAGMILGVQATPGADAAARGAAFGRGLVTLLSVIAGIVLIVMHFVRRKRP